MSAQMHAHATFSHLEDNIWFESISQTCGEINDGFFIISPEILYQHNLPSQGLMEKCMIIYSFGIYYLQLRYICLLDYSPSFSMSG